VYLLVALGGGSPKNFDDFRRDIHQPDFQDSCASIQRNLHLSISIRGGIGDFDHEQYILWTREFWTIVVRLPPKQGQIRLWFGMRS